MKKKTQKGIWMSGSETIKKITISRKIEKWALKEPSAIWDPQKQANIFKSSLKTYQMQISHKIVHYCFCYNIIRKKCIVN